MLIAFAFFAGGIVAILAGLAQRDRLIAARRWERVDGEVRSARVIQEAGIGDGGGRSYRAEIRYAYVVNGVEHIGSRRQLLDFESLSRGHAQDVVHRYPQGHRVTVHYDPNNPANAALEVPDTSMLPILYMAAGVAISIVGVYKWWHLP